MAGAAHRLRDDRMSRALGQVALASFVVCMVTGVVLMYFYDRSTRPVTYDGSYTPLQGATMSRALESTIDLSFEVRGGLLLRQLHHWSASFLIAALMLQILRVFFIGAFGSRRRITWLLLWGLLLTTMGAGFTGLILPDDMVSGSSLAVMDGVLRSVPVVGTDLSDLVFRGEFPSGSIALFYPLHVIVLPLVMLTVVAALVWRVRRPLTARVSLRHSMIRSLAGAGPLVVIAGVLTLIAATVTVNPVWTYGPADPGNASAGAGATWYLAFLDGAQRLVPPGWEVVWLDRTWTFAILVPVGVSTLFLGAAMAYPFVERRVIGTRQDARAFARPRTTPTRTGLGAAGITFYGVLWAAAGSDTMALQLGLGVEGVIHTLQVALVAGPPLAYEITRRICLGLHSIDRDIALHGRETGRIIRTPEGGFHEVRRPVTAAERERLLDAPADDVREELPAP
ncbi:cytochrome b [Luteipulveratus halotolerans]|uniref:cytochrome b n=1 Tax=Luteipulveratus halotolerans TaxID=1631356 RepID=UPI0006835022|nr:cytochrome b N-terminal domain-containing protein [Luteipulveratus halotolerans]